VQIWLFCLLVLGDSAYAVVGANTPFTCHEAEVGTLAGGARVRSLTAAPTNSASSPELEASGHAFAQLDATGQSVTLTNTTGQNITALNVRYSIPDATNGGGITATLNLYVDGVFRQSISLNSTQTWCYQKSGSEHGWSQDPSYGSPHIFYDETHFFISGSAVAPGSTLSFQKDATNSASFYWLDVVDMENPPAPLTQPANSLSILTYGALANDITKDSTAAIQSCINAAQTQHKTVWVPPGIYYLNSSSASISATGITIAGAGMWYSTIYANPTLPASSQNIIYPISCTLQDLCFDANARSGGSGDGNGGGLNVKGNNWVINNVWVQHLGAGIWADGSNGIIKNSRTSSTWADGMNINNGNGATGNNVGNFLTISNCFVRGSGDDGLALNSGNSIGCLQMTNTTVVCCTSVVPWWANNLGIYGGVNILVSNNLCLDSVGAYGISVGQFGTSGLPLESGTVVSNVIVRGGSYGFYNQAGVSALNVGTTAISHNLFVAGNIVSNALFMGMGFEKCGSNVIAQYNRIVSPGSDGINIPSGAVGAAVLYSNAVTGLTTGKAVLVNNSSVFTVATAMAASAYDSMSGVALEPCAESGQDLTTIENGDWAAYTNINLAGVNTFVARVACAGAGGSIEIHTDSASGTLIGTCSVTASGGSQAYTNVYCKVAGASGTHTVYLAFTGGISSLFNVEYFGLYSAPPAPTHNLVVGNTYSFRAANSKYVTADNNGTNALIAKSTSIGPAERFTVLDAGSGNIGLRAVVNSLYVCVDSGGASPLIANRTSVGSWETFTEVDAGNGNIGLRANANSKYVTAANNGASALIAKSTNVGIWESFILVAPPPVPGVTPAADYTQVALSWTASAGATAYNVKRSLTNGGPYVILASNLTDTNYTDTGLTNLTAYYYVVSAQNDAGESANSAQVSATPGILSRGGWMANASSTESGGSSARAIDGDITTRWSTGANQANGQWFQVDMGATNTFYQIILDAASSSGDYPRGYLVNVSNDGSNWGSPVATGAGSSAVTTISFATNTARHIRVTQTGNSGPWWSIHEFNVYGTRGGPPVTPADLAAAAGDGRVVLTWSASPNAAGYNVKQATISNGSYTVIATNLAGLSFTNTGLANGTRYYYAVSARNLAGESANSAVVSVQPAPMSPPLLRFGLNAGPVQLTWPADHTAWRLEVQTNSLAAGLGTNWVTVPDSTATNQMTFPIDPTAGSIFFRMVYP
jgi:hypothetical protein